MEEQKDLPNTKSWEGFIDTYLKTEHIEEFPARVVVLDVNSVLSPNKKVQLIFDVEYNKKKFKWNCNKTNMRKLENAKLGSPFSAIGKVLTFEKIRVQNPSTKQSVDSLEVIEIK